MADTSSADTSSYAARLEVDYPEKLDRLTTFLRLIWAIPILIIYGLISSTATTTRVNEAGEVISQSSGGIAAGLFVATVLMILFRQKYPRWWFDFGLEFGRFATRVWSYLVLLTDRYPSTDEAQGVHLDADYPDAEKLNRWLPLVKWLLAIPHYIILVFLFIAMAIVTILAWFIILFTGQYPRGMFDFVVGTMRWAVRVWAYAFLLTTDEYPPFSMS